MDFDEIYMTGMAVGFAVGLLVPLIAWGAWVTRDWRTWPSPRFPTSEIQPSRQWSDEAKESKQ